MEVKLYFSFSFINATPVASCAKEALVAIVVLPQDDWSATEFFFSARWSRLGLARRPFPASAAVPKP